jgi:molybdopterin synthase catalytic subunit
MVRLQREPIRVEQVADSFAAAGDGAVAFFVGTVRDNNGGRKVLRLEYHAYPEMAEAEMARIEKEALARFGVTSVVLIHRVGMLQIGEASVLVAAASPHRAQAFDACRFAIEMLKASVPIWKKEGYEGGEAWIGDGAENGSHG